MGDKALFTRGNLIFLFITAFLAGAIAKKAINNHVRIGFDDPKTIIMKGTLLNIDDLEQDLIREGIPQKDFSNESIK